MTSSGGFPEGFQPNSEQIGEATGEPRLLVRAHSVLECFSVDQDQAWFRKADESDSTGPWITLSVQQFHDMGDPGKITVTVEPGDRLTDVPDEPPF